MGNKCHAFICKILAVLYKSNKKTNSYYEFKHNINRFEHIPNLKTIEICIKTINKDTKNENSFNRLIRPY